LSKIYVVGFLIIFLKISSGAGALSEDIAMVSLDSNDSNEDARIINYINKSNYIDLCDCTDQFEMLRIKVILESIAMSWFTICPTAYENLAYYLSNKGNPDGEPRYTDPKFFQDQRSVKNAMNSMVVKLKQELMQKVVNDLKFGERKNFEIALHESVYPAGDEVCLTFTAGAFGLNSVHTGWIEKKCNNAALYYEVFGESKWEVVDLYDFRGLEEYQYSSFKDYWKNNKLGIFSEYFDRLARVLEECGQAKEFNWISRWYTNLNLNLTVDPENSKMRNCSLEGCRCLTENEANDTFKSPQCKGYERCSEDPCGCRNGKPTYCYKCNSSNECDNMTGIYAFSFSDRDKWVLELYHSGDLANGRLYLLGNEGASHPDATYNFEANRKKDDSNPYLHRYLFEGIINGYPSSREIVLDSDDCYEIDIHEFDPKTNTSSLIPVKRINNTDLEISLQNYLNISKGLDLKSLNGSNRARMLVPFSEVIISDTIIDITPNPTAYIEGAIALPYDMFFSNKRLKQIDEIKKMLSDAGVSPDAQIDIYGNCPPCGGDSSPATFVYSILDSLGYEKVRIIDGTIEQWNKAGLPTATNPSIKPMASYILKNTSELFVNKEYVKSGQTQIIDARTPEEFNNGAIPDAINIPFEQVYSDRKIKDDDSLRDIFKDIDKSKPVVVYTSNGVKASAVWFALKILDYDSKLYTWLDWMENP